MNELRVGSLFSGIGGNELGLERTGHFKTVWQCECNEFCRGILTKHWPDVPCFRDVTKLARRVHDCEPEDEEGEVWCPRCQCEFGECACIGTDQLIDEHGAVDMICGGFPCQDVSNAGKRGGIEAERSGLWTQFARIIREVGPRWVIIENTAGLRGRGFHRVLSDLAEIGFDAEWSHLRACDLENGYIPSMRKR